MTYNDEQKACGFKLGDKVKVIRKAERGWSDVWNPNMNTTVGMIGTILYIYGGSSGIRVMFRNGISWVYPYFVLNKIVPPSIQIEKVEITLGGNTVAISKPIAELLKNHINQEQTGEL